MRSTFQFVGRHVWTLLLVCGLVGVVGVYFYATSGSSTTTATFAVVEKVGRGTVSSGIEATGEIVAAHTLDLNVYKQIRRIEAVNVANGAHVKKGDVLFSFDKSGVLADVKTAQVEVANAELALSTKKENASDPNTTVRTLNKEIASLRTSILQAEQDKILAYRDFLNANILPEPGNTKSDLKERPEISGLYSGTIAGTYRIDVYRADAESGYAYRVTGLENDTQSVIVGIATPVGTKGLKILFGDDLKTGDAWTITLPNSYAPEYIENKEDYEKAIVDFDEAIIGYKTDIANKLQQVDDLELTDGDVSRDLGVLQAEAKLAETLVQLSENYDVVREQDIIAPFSGSIEGLENVVVGATPTRDTNDPIVLGTLISDEFLVKFSLGAADVSEVAVGQKVQLTVTSFPNMQPLEASVVEISSLPDESGVAQYGVKALIHAEGETLLLLREGLIADVLIVNDEKKQALRVPVAALSYIDGIPKVTVVDALTEEQKKQVASQGIVRTDTAALATYVTPVELGIIGKFYVEIMSGVTENTYLLTTGTVGTSTGSVVGQANFGPPRERTSSPQTTGARN